MNAHCPNFINRHIIVPALLLLAFALSACSGDSGETVEGIHLVNKGELTVCSHLPYKPFEYTNDDGKVVGFDVSLAYLLAHDLGVDLTVISIDGSQFISGAAFAAGKCDMGMGGLTITEKRKKAVDFSDPYFKATQALLVKTNSGIKNLPDMKGMKLGVMATTTGKLYAEKHAARDGYTLVIFDDLSLLLNAVSSGKVAGALQDNGPLGYYATLHPDTHVVATFDTGERYGFLFEKNNDNADKLRTRFNKVLAQARKDGAYDNLFRQWFGSEPSAGTKS